MFDYWIKWFKKPNGEKNPPINRVICHKLCDEWNCKCALSCVLNEKQRLVHPIEIIANVIENSIEMECFASGLKKMFPCFVLSTSLSVEMKKSIDPLWNQYQQLNHVLRWCFNSYSINFGSMQKKIICYRVLAYSFFFCNYKHWSCNCKRKCSFKILCSSVKSKNWH